MKEKVKMQWLIDKGGIDQDKVFKTRENKGTIMIPTGGGKSGLMMENAIHYIKGNRLNRKMVFVFNGPILRIVAQTVNDFLSVLNGTCKKEIENGEVMFFMNSSDNGDSYENSLSEIGVSAYPFKGNSASMGFEAFLNSNKAKYAVVASCNRSLYKFDACIEEIKKNGIDVFVYLDEAHTLSVHAVNNSEKYDEESRTFVDFSKLCKANYVYAFSATPDQEVTAEINKYNGHSGDPSFYIIKESPADYIAANIICAPKPAVIRVREGYVLESEICEMFMNQLKMENNSIFQKILLTVSSWEEVERLEKELDSLGYKVFSTCCELGMRENGVKVTTDAVKFTNIIDGYRGDCFVIHIKQLTAGIDIKSLTGTIIVNNQHGDTDNYRTFIQNIGRTLRIGEDDVRGDDIEKRNKKYGYVLFVIPEHFNRETTLAFFMNRYYALDNLDFVKGIHEWHGHGNTELTFESLFKGIDFDDEEFYPTSIKEMLASIEEYIKKEIKPEYDYCKEYNIPWNGHKELESIVKEYSLRNQKELKNCNVADFLNDTWLIEKVKYMLEKWSLVA